MSTRWLMLSQKTGKARFFLNLHSFIHFVCGHFGSGQPVTFGAVFFFTQVDSTNYCLARKQRVALMCYQLNSPLVQGLTLPFRRPHRSTGWSRRKREERRFWRTGCLYWEFRCLSKAPMPSKVQSGHIYPTQTLSSFEIHSLKKRKKIIAKSQLYSGLNLFIVSWLHSYIEIKSKLQRYFKWLWHIGAP